MSSNTERAPKVGAQAGAKEATINFLLREIGGRAPSPTQAVKVCQILGLATRENIRRVREIAKNKNEVAPEAENKKEEGMKMRTEWGQTHYENLLIEKSKRFMDWLCLRIDKEILKKKTPLRIRRYANEHCLGLIDVVMSKEQLAVSLINPSGSSRPHIVLEYVKKEGFSVKVSVYNKDFLQIARFIGRICERKIKKEVVVEKQY